MSLLPLRDYGTDSHMKRRLTTLCAALLTLCVGGGAAAAAEDDSLAAWKAGVKVGPVAPAADRHTIHSYYLACPESPDGRHLLFYASTAANGHEGQIVVRQRASGDETVIARGITTEDAHRAACQQWISQGKRVAFHNVRDGAWAVHVVELATRQERTFAPGRQLAFGQPAGDWLPIYGCHWKPGPHRDLELLHAVTGELQKPVTIAAVERAYGDWLKRQFDGQPTSIFFPVVSPDQQRVFFKMAAGSGGDEFRSKAASRREGLIAYDLGRREFLFFRERWGHPAWHPDSKRILEAGNLLLDVENKGQAARIPDLPALRGCHPAVSPDGRLFVQDGLSDGVGGPPGEWCILIGDVRGGAGRYEVLHRFSNARGARSWRRNDPHPVFSADGRRVYFNVSDGEWTQLYVAERGGP